MIRPALSLRTRYSFVLVGLILSALAVGGGVSVWQFRAAMSEMFASAADRVADALSDSSVIQARDLARFTAGSLANALQARDIREIENIARSVRGQGDVLDVIVFDRDGRILDNGRDYAARLNAQVSPELNLVVEQGRTLESRHDSELRIAVPVLLGAQPLGGVEIAVSTAQVAYKIAWLRNALMRLERTRLAALLTGLAITAAVIAVVGAVVGLLIAGGFTRPLQQISLFTRRVGRGDYDAPLDVRRRDELGQLADDLRHMAEDLRRFAQHSRLSMLGEMAVGVAHELNQPLNVMRMAADNALAALDGGRSEIAYIRAKLDLLTEESGRMGEIIRRMCSLARADDSRTLVNPEECVIGALNLLRSQLNVDDIEVSTRFDHGKARVLAHSQQLTHAIINIVSNARDAIVAHAARSAAAGRPPARGRIEIVSRTLPDRAAVEISISDNGGGIPEVLLQRIFDPFITTKEASKGTGLGLSLSLSFVNAIGGGIVATNIDGGASFKIWLPLWKEIGNADAERL